MKDRRFWIIPAIIIAAFGAGLYYDLTDKPVIHKPSFDVEQLKSILAGPRERAYWKLNSSLRLMIDDANTLIGLAKDVARAQDSADLNRIYRERRECSYKLRNPPDCIRPTEYLKKEERAVILALFEEVLAEKDGGQKIMERTRDARL